MATDYDEVRSDVKESQDRSLEALQSANAPDARSVVRELDEADSLDGAMVPGGEIVAEELTVQVIPQAEDEFTCYSCSWSGTAPRSRAKRTATPTALTAKAKQRSRRAGRTDPVTEHRGHYNRRMTVLDWLLDSDPSIRWQALRDLAGAPADVVAAERARVATEGWGARLLALRGEDGQWAGGAYFPARGGAPDGREPALDRHHVQPPAAA